MIKEETIEILISYRNLTHYLKLGYNAILNSNLLIKSKDLPSGSHVKVTAICELCGNEKSIINYKYVKNIERFGYYGCNKCSVHKRNLSNISNNPERTNNYIDDDKFKNAERLSKRVISYSEDRLKDICCDNYINYRREVRKLTRRNIKTIYKNWDGYDYYDGEFIKIYENLKHTDNKYPSIDHMISIYDGFINNIPPEEIGNISNLCITKRSNNSLKRHLNEEEFIKLLKENF